MADVKTEVFECPNCCDRNNAQLLQDISILQAMIEKLKLWLGSVPREFREEEENSSEIVQSMKVWLKNIPTEFAWWTDGVGVKSEEAQHLIILEDHAELEDSAVLEERGEGSELKLEAGDFGRFHEEPMDYAGVDPLTLDFDAGDITEDYSNSSAKSDGGKRQKRQCYDKTCPGSSTPACKTCAMCKRRHRCEKKLCEHVKLSQEELTCPKCNKLFKGKDNLSKHMKLPYCHRVKPIFPRDVPKGEERVQSICILYSCTIHQSATITDKRELRLHIEEYHPGDPDVSKVINFEFKCAVCPFLSVDRRRVRTHVSKNHPDIIQRRKQK